MSPEKEILIISEKIPELTLGQIVAHTSLEMNEAEIAIHNLVTKGIASETVDTTGQKIYTFKNKAFRKLQEKRDVENFNGALFVIIIIAIIIFVIYRCTGG
jgi:hypothetical protein